jgi:GNAT superfamily N-acetyltransferase
VGELTSIGFRILDVDWDDARAASLRDELDADLGARYDGFHGDEPAERTAARARALAMHPDEIVATLVAVVDEEPVGHVILRRLGSEWEIKRLIVTPAARGRGIARALVAAALGRARDGAAERVILQTGIPQPESIALYESMGFTRIPVYEPYAETMPRSVCFSYAF